MIGTWPARMGRVAVAEEEEGVVVKGEDGENQRVLQPPDPKAQSVIALWLVMGILEISLRMKTLQDPVTPPSKKKKASDTRSKTSKSCEKGESSKRSIEKVEVEDSESKTKETLKKTAVKKQKAEKDTETKKKAQKDMETTKKAEKDTDTKKKTEKATDTKKKAEKSSSRNKEDVDAAPSEVKKNTPKTKKAAGSGDPGKALLSRKSSAYHQAKRAAMRAGKSPQEAVQEAKQAHHTMFSIIPFLSLNSPHAKM